LPYIKGKMRREFSPVGVSSGFTLIEMLIILAIAGLLFGVAWPEMNSMVQRSKEMECLSLTRQVKAAKNSYVMDHLGESSPEVPIAGDRAAVFRTYFPEGFSSTCPATGNALPNVYDMYSETLCPHCGSSTELGMEVEER